MAAIMDRIIHLLCLLALLSSQLQPTLVSATDLSTSSALPPIPTIGGNNPPKCKPSSAAVTQFLAAPPYTNYFLSTCNVAGQVVVTSPLPESNLTFIGPRLLAAFPGGNSGIAAFFAPANGVNGSLSLQLVQNSKGGNLTEVYKPAASGSKYPSVGLSGVLAFNDSAVLTLPILGSVRTIRDFTEGPSLLVPEIQEAIKVKTMGASVILSRLWLDNITTTELGFTPLDTASKFKIDNQTVTFPAGDYLFWTDYNFPQLDQLNASVVLNPAAAQVLVKQQPDLTTSLTFLSYSEKLLAGAWRFLTYFGRDSMIAALLLEPVLSQGEGGALEAVIGAVLERINRTDGSVCHEETLGDYATYLNQKDNNTSTAASLTYPMVDTYFYLPILMQRYFLDSANGTGRYKALFSTPAGSIDVANKNLTWGELALKNAETIMALAATFAAHKDNQTIENLVHLKSDQVVGNWRDSTFGIGGGRIPYDVNTALMPAALRAIAALSRAGIYSKSKHPHWGRKAERYARVWEDETLKFFKISIPAAVARSRLATYVNRTSTSTPSVYSGPDQASSFQGEPSVDFHALSLQGNDGLAQVQVMNSDDCFRLFLFANISSNQKQLTAFINQTALNVQRPFPAGLMTSVGMLVANPAYGEQAVYAANFSTNDYQGTVVWSWQQAMMAKGFEVQLLRCNTTGKETENDKKKAKVPAFCHDAAVRANALKAYNALWDVIEANRAHVSTEVWSWVYKNNNTNNTKTTNSAGDDNGGGRFQYTDLAALPPPAGLGVTESDIRQLWSLTFLAVTRNQGLAVPE